MTRTVLKFGGTSVASPAALQRVAEIVKNTRGHRIVVVSATAGTTDALIGAARAAEGGGAQTAQDTIHRLSGEHRNLIADALGFHNPLEPTRMVFRRVPAHNQHHVGVFDIYPAIGHCTASERWSQT